MQIFDINKMSMPKCKSIDDSSPQQSIIKFSTLFYFIVKPINANIFI